MSICGWNLRNRGMETGLIWGFTKDRRLKPLIFQLNKQRNVRNVRLQSQLSVPDTIGSGSIKFEPTTAESLPQLQ